MTVVVDRDHVARKAEAQLREAEKMELWEQEARHVTGADQ